jgi:hypothetical protein
MGQGELDQTQTQSNQHRPWARQIEVFDQVADKDGGL